MKVLLAAVAMTAGLLVPSAAEAGPSPASPATTPMTRPEAVKTARYVLRRNVAFLFEAPRHSRLGVCRPLHKDHLVWSCRIRVGGPDTDCRGALLLWRDDDSYWFELRNLRCRAP